jgi:hypothetical protein
MKIDLLCRRLPAARQLPSILVMAALAVSAGAPTANAADDSYGDINSYLSVERLDIGPANCAVAATINYDGVVSHMPAIRDAWLSQEKTTEFYQRHAIEMIFGIVDHKAGGILLEAVYEKGQTKHPDKCHFTLNIAKPDDFGQVKTYPQLSWDFTAALASRVAWNTFDDRNLSKIALKFTPEAERLLKEENGEPAKAPATDVPDRPRSCSDILALDVAEAFGNSPYAQDRHLKVLDATNPTALPQRPGRGFACISRLVTNGGTLNVLVEPKLLNGKWYVSVEKVP